MANITIDLTGEAQSLVSEVDRTINKYEELDSTIDQTNEAIQKTFEDGADSAAAFNSELEDTTQQSVKQKSALDQLRTEYARLTKARNQSTDPKDIVAFNRKLEDTETQIKQIQNAGRKGFDELGNKIEEVGQKAENTGGAFSGLLDVAGGFGIAFGVDALISGVVAVGQEIIEVTETFREARGEAQLLFGVTGQALDDVVARGMAISNTFDRDFNEVLQAANVISKEFGVTQAEAFEQLEAGFLAGADANGELIDSVREYSSQIAQAGGDTGDLLQILQQSTTEGIFSDKGIDVVKEFGLRIREQADGTSEALRVAFGDEFADNLLKGVRDGSISTIDAIKQVSEQLNDTSLDASAVQTVIADVFGGPGEDAGLRYLQLLKDIDGDITGLVDDTNALTRQQIAQLEVQEDLARAQQEIAKVFEDDSVGLFTDRLKVLGFEILLDLINVFKETGASIRAAIEPISEIIDELGLFGDETQDNTAILDAFLLPVKAIAFQIQITADFIRIIAEVTRDWIQQNEGVRDALTRVGEIARTVFDFIVEQVYQARDAFASLGTFFTEGNAAFEIEVYGKAVRREFASIIEAAEEADLRQRQALVRTLQAQRVAILEQVQNNENLSIETKRQLKEQFDARTEAINQINALIEEELQAQNELTEETEEQSKRRTQATAKEIEAQKKRNEEFLKLSQELSKRVRDQEFAALSESERLAFLEREAQLEIDALEARLREVGTITAEQEEQLATLRLGIAQSFVMKRADLEKRALEEELRQRQDLIKEDIEAIDNAEALRLAQIQNRQNTGLAEVEFERQKQRDILAIQLEAAEQRRQLLLKSGTEEDLIRAEQLRTTIDQLETGLQDLEQTSLKFDLAKLFDVSEEELDQIGQAIGQTLSTAFNFVSDIAAQQAESIGEELGRINDQLTTQSALVTDQLELRAQGLDNNADLELARLRELQSARDEALAQQEEAVRRQEALENIQQLSSLITSSANIIQSLSPLGPFGIALAGFTIATMFAAFAAAKQQARQEVQTFGEGGGLMLKGPSHREGGIGLYNNKTGQEIAQYEGDEYLYAVRKREAAKNLPLLEAINEGTLGPEHIPDHIIDELLYGTGVRMDRKAPTRLRNLSVQLEEQKVTMRSAIDDGGMKQELQDLNAKFDEFVEEYKSKPMVIETDTHTVIKYPNGDKEHYRKRNA